jgi:hypothetical protein
MECCTLYGMLYSLWNVVLLVHQSEARREIREIFCRNTATSLVAIWRWPAAPNKTHAVKFERALQNLTANEEVRSMRIAQIAPLTEAVPPKLYG